ncbi:MAG: glycosyltransferase family A protein [Candidatus Saccharimonadales bacterium]|nr:glycosyltransferase family A protein [Candidatus Saccharimonadales bacterium]
MSEIKYQVVSQTPTLCLRRGSTKVIKVRLKNVGSETWTTETDQADQLRLSLKMIDEKLDQEFKYRTGKIYWRKTQLTLWERIKYKLDNRLKKTAAPGQNLVMYFQVISKKYATGGWHRVEIAPFVRDQDDIKTSNQARQRFTRVYVRRDDYFWFHLKRTLKLTFSKPGELSSQYENRVFKRANPSEQTGYMPVVMAVWQRVENLPKTIEALKKQTGTKPVLYLWNNNPAVVSKIEKIAAQTKLPIKIYHSAYNIGGFGRFYLARELAKDYVKVLFIDDDQLLAPNTVSSYAHEFEPQSIKGYWAYKFLDQKNYWRKKIIAANQPAEYIGTGGMLVDTAIFSDPRVFKCPKRFWFIEDVWLSFVATHYLGWKSVKTKTTLQIDEDGKDQLNKLIDQKTKMLKYLLKKGWKIDIAD